MLSLTVTAVSPVDFTTNSSSNLSNTCFLTSSYDGSEDLVSPETEFLIGKLKSAVFLPLMFVLGAPANLSNMIVFFKQGLHDRINLCLFCLALVDFTTISFCFLLFAEQIFMFTSHEIYGPLFQSFINNKILLFYSSGNGSNLLSVIIACERCLCVLMPLRAKLLLKTKNMAGIVLTAVPLVCFLRLVVTAKYIARCVFDKRRQLTLMNITVTEYAARYKELLDFLDGIFYGFIIGVGCPIVVLITTVITTVKLWQTVSWRKQTASANAKKEVAVTKMLILLSIEFLIFSLPRVLLRVYPLFKAEFSAKGKYQYFFFACVSINEVCISMGSASSFIVYYISSSKYRKIWHSLFSRKICKRFDHSLPRSVKRSLQLSRKSLKAA